MSQDFFSHARKNEEGKQVGSKHMAQHVAAVTALSQAQFYSKVGFEPESAELQVLLRRITQFHDLGKFTRYFQDYLLGKPADWELKRHARLGAVALLNRLEQEGKSDELAFIAYYLVLCHHRNLHEPCNAEADALLNFLEPEMIAEPFQKQVATFAGSMATIEAVIGEPLAEALQRLPDGEQWYEYLTDWLKSLDSPHAYFLINYLFSLLIEADKLDASDTEPHSLQPLLPDAVNRRIASFGADPSLHNQLRAQVRARVLANLDRPDILEQRLMLLTAPTGIGKTLTALDFALNLRHRIWQTEGRQAQIITALPFINIIEQTLSEYQAVFALDYEESPELRILAHYQYADVLGEQRDGQEEKRYDQKVMQLDTWQADIVITSFVQLLQTLITNRNKLLKKFNHLAGAIVIMDEVQSIKLDQVPLVGAMLYYLSKYLDTRLILMTATQPLLFELADEHLLQGSGESASQQAFHLLPDARQYFQQFRRTQLVPLLESTLPDEAAFVELFAREWQPHQACLIVCNKVQRALDVYIKLQEWLCEQGHQHPIHHLSTNVIPAHRMERIQTIKAQLEVHRAGDADALPPILVATQVVEAGVDLDFDLGFRDLGPIDSIVQVAGRLNRENSDERVHTPLYVVDFGDCQKIYGPVTNVQARKVLAKGSIPEEDYFDMVATYFQAKGEKTAFHQSRYFFDSIKKLNYDGADDYAISKFTVIPHAEHASSVFVEWDDAAAEAREAFLAISRAKGEAKRAAKQRFDLHYKRTFHQHVIAVPKYLIQDRLERIDPTQPDLEIYLVPNPELSTYYHSDTGFRREAGPPPKIPTLTF